MRALPHLLALVAFVGLLLPGELAGGSAAGAGAVLSPERALPAWPAEPGSPRLHDVAPGGEPLLASAHEERERKRAASDGPPAPPARGLAASCPPPATKGGAGPLSPGESPPGQAFLRVNGAADAHGARA